MASIALSCFFFFYFSAWIIHKICRHWSIFTVFRNYCQGFHIVLFLDLLMSNLILCLWVLVILCSLLFSCYKVFTLCNRLAISIYIYIYLFFYLFLVSDYCCFCIFNTFFNCYTDNMCNIYYNVLDYGKKY